MATVTLYLGFEGVLHPAEVSFREGLPPRMRTPGHTLFENNALLEHVINARPETCIILHTWWVRFVGYKAAVRQLPPAVQTRVIGATSPGNRTLRFTLKPTAARREWLRADIARRQPENPVLLDYDWGQVPATLQDRSLIVDGDVGLSSLLLCNALIGMLDSGVSEDMGRHPNCFRVPPTVCGAMPPSACQAANRRVI